MWSVDRSASCRSLLAKLVKQVQQPASTDPETALQAGIDVAPHVPTNTLVAAPGQVVCTCMTVAGRWGWVGLGGWVGGWVGKILAFTRASAHALERALTHRRMHIDLHVVPCVNMNEGVMLQHMYSWLWRLTCNWAVHPE